MCMNLDLIGLFHSELLILSAETFSHILIIGENGAVELVHAIDHLVIKFAGNSDRYIYQINLKLGHIALFTLEQHALDCWAEKHIWLSWHALSQLGDRCPLCYMLMFKYYIAISSAAVLFSHIMKMFYEQNKSSKCFIETLWLHSRASWSQFLSDMRAPQLPALSCKDVPLVCN